MGQGDYLSIVRGYADALDADTPIDVEICGGLPILITNRISGMTGVGHYGAFHSASRKASEHGSRSYGIYRPVYAHQERRCKFRGDDNEIIAQNELSPCCRHFLNRNVSELPQVD